MNTKIKILIVEHDPVDIDLMMHELDNGNVNYEAEIVSKESAYETALHIFAPDIILSDYTFPSFDGLTAFKIKERTCPHIPFIIVSGTIGEENAIKLIKDGVDDFVLKDRLLTLPIKITRALKDATEKRAKLESDVALYDLARELTRAQEIAHVGSWKIDLNSNSIHWSEEACKIYGFPEGNSLQSFRIWLTFIHPDDVEFVTKQVRDGFASRIDSSFKFRFIENGNLIKHGRIEWRFEFDKNGDPIGLNGIVQDITEREGMLNKLQKTNDLLAFISQINKKIVRIKNKEALFLNSCSIAIEYGKFKMAWIGLFNDVSEKITLVGQSGINNKDLKLFDGASLIPNGPQHQVLLRGEYFICNDLANLPELEDWQSFASTNNIRSLMVLPIMQSGRIIGTFNLYSSSLNVSDKDEINLLVEIANDISFSLDNLEKDRKQKHTQELIMSNELRFRTLIEKSQDMQTLATAEGEIVYASPSISKVLGYENIQEYLGQSIVDFVHPDDLAVFAELGKEMYENPGKSIFMEQRILHRNGSWIWCEGTFTNMLHEPSINAIVSNFRDISEKKLAEEIREFEKNNLDALIDNTDGMMWSLDRNLRLITCNQPFRDIIHTMTSRTLEKGELIWVEGLSEKTIAQYTTFYERALAGETFSVTVNNEFPPETWSEISFNPIRYQDEIIGTACNARDVTQGKLAERKLQKSEKGLKESQAVGHLGNWELDLATRIGTWSEETCRIYGVPEDHIRHSYDEWKSFVYPDDLDDVLRIMEESENALTNANFYHRILLENGTIKHIHTVFKFQFDEIGDPIGMYGIAHDVTDLKETEKELKKSEAFNNGVINSLPSHIAVLDGLGNIVAVNDAWKNFGLNNGGSEPEKYLEGSNYFRVCENAYKSGDLAAGEILQGMKDVLDGNRNGYYHEYPCHSPTQEAWFGLRVMKFGGEDDMVVVAHQNITERMQAEHKLLKSESRLKEAQAIAHTGNWEIDLVNNVYNWSDELYNIIGVSKDDISLTPEILYSFIHPEDLQGMRNSRQNSIDKLQDSSYNFRFIHTDGSLRYGYIERKFEFDEANKPIRLYGIVQDVTERKLAEFLIFEGEGRLAEAQSMAKIGNWETDLENLKVVWSKETYRVFDLDPEAFKPTHTSFLDFVHPDDREAVNQAFMDTSGDGEIKSIEHRIITPAGITKIIEQRWRIISNETGSPIRAVGTCQDITEPRIAEIKLELQNKELQKTNTELDRFVYSVSHDLRAPLSSMLGIIDISLDFTEEELMKQHLTMLKGNVKKLDGFIGDILDYSRNARMEVVNKRIVFTDLLGDISTNLKYMGGSNRLVDIIIECNDTTPIFSDKSRLAIVLNNLVSNAIRYQNTEIQNPFVKVVTESSGTNTMLTISDNGMGIKKEFHEKIFDMFYRVSESSVGSGLGLYIVKESITKIGGTIVIQSEIGKGTTFKIKIPNN